MDINGDGVDEITGHISSPENIHYPIPYTDSATWLMVIDPLKMDFHFPPIKFDVGIGSWIKPVFFSVNNKKYIAVTVYSNSAKKQIDYIQLKLFSNNGKLLKENNINTKEIGSLVFINPNNKRDNSFYLIDNFCNIYKTDTSLKLSLFYEPEIGNIYLKIHRYDLMDIDGDGNNELLFLGGDTKANKFLLIYRHNLKDAIAIMLPESKSSYEYHLCMIK